MQTSPIMIAMWSGPRNISTAMMRSFGARADCQVVDEPFYAAFLEITGLDHPMREEILEAGETDWHKVADSLIDPASCSKPVFYQKHMTHHMVEEIGRDWFASVRHAFLIRRPEDVLASYNEKRETVELRDIGFVEQAEIFDAVCDLTGETPPVVEGIHILSDPPGMLGKLCAALGIDFDPAMLSWPPGRRDTDGIWAPYWYGRVEQSTGFAPPGKIVDRADLPANLQRIAEEATPYFDRMQAVKL